jgi:hypothetical protein
VGLERGPLSLVSTTEELLESESRDSDIENRNTAVGIRRADHETPLSPQTLANFDKWRSPGRYSSLTD